MAISFASQSAGLMLSYTCFIGDASKPHGDGGSSTGASGSWPGAWAGSSAGLSVAVGWSKSRSRSAAAAFSAVTNFASTAASCGDLGTVSMPRETHASWLLLPELGPTAMLQRSNHSVRGCMEGSVDAAASACLQVLQLLV